MLGPLNLSREAEQKVDLFPQSDKMKVLNRGCVEHAHPVEWAYTPRDRCSTSKLVLCHEGLCNEM